MSKHILRPPRPYEGMNITGATGLTAAQRETLRALGAVPDATPVRRGDLAAITALIAVVAPRDLDRYGLAPVDRAGQLAAIQPALVALGPQLAQAGVGAVVAMHDNVAIATVQAGMPVFFAELRRHGQVDRALAAMRSVLAARGDDW